MSMTAQEWQEIELNHSWQEIEFEKEVVEAESERPPKRPRKPMDPMIYPAFLAVLGVLGTLVMFVYAIRTAGEHVPHRDSINMIYEQHQMYDQHEE